MTAGRDRKLRRQLAEMIVPDLAGVNPIGVSIGGQIAGSLWIVYESVLEQAADGDAAEDVHALQRCGRGRGQDDGHGRDEDEVSGGTARASAERSREYPCFSYL